MDLSPDAFAEILAAAKARWPKVRLEPELFRRRLEQAVRGQEDPARSLAALETADLFLACALAAGDSAAVASFERSILAALPKFIARVGTASAFVDEVAQRVREKLLVGSPPKIASYSGRGPLGGWVRMVSMRVAVDVLREQARELPTDPDDALSAIAGSDGELGWLKERYRDRIKAAFDVAFASLSPGERTLLRLHLIDDLSIDEIGVLRRAHRSTVARQIARCRQKLIGETRRSLRASFGGDDAGIDSLIRLVRSQIDLSIRSRLG